MMVIVIMLIMMVMILVVMAVMMMMIKTMVVDPPICLLQLSSFFRFVLSPIFFQILLLFPILLFQLSSISRPCGVSLSVSGGCYNFSEIRCRSVAA